MPVIDCFPLYYAQRMGMFEAEGLDVRLQTYLSQMDCDTALLNRRTEVALTDLPRLLEMQGDSTPLRAIMTTGGRLSLVTAKKARIRTLKHLNERMVALDRLTWADYWSDELMKQAGLEQAAIYRPQINDIRLRTSMLTDQLVDGAMLPEPYATQAEEKGHNRLYTTSDSAISFTCLAISRQLLADKRRVAQVATLLRIYNKAVGQLNRQPNRDTLQAILVQDYQVPAEVADTTWTFTPGRLPQESEAQTAYKWLRTRERRIRQSALDSLVSPRFFPSH